MAFGVVFLVFMGLEWVFRLLDELRTPDPGYTFVDALVVSVSGLPRRLYLDLPLIVLIAVATALGGLAQSSALTVLRAAGMSLLQIVRIAVLALAPVLGLSVVVAEVGVIDAERFSRAHRAVELDTDAGRQRIWTKENDRFVQIRGRLDGALVGWTEIALFPDRPQMQQLITARRAEWTDGEVALSRVLQLSFSDDRIVLDTTNLTRDTALSPRTLRWLVQDPETLRLSELAEAVGYLSSEGLNADRHSQLFWQRLLLPLTLVVLIGLASVTSFGSARGVSMSTRVFLAVLLGLGFKYSIDLAGPTLFLLGWHPALTVVLPLMLPLGLTVWIWKLR